MSKKILSYERVQELAGFAGWHCILCEDGGVVLASRFFSTKAAPDTILKDLRSAKKNLLSIEMDYLEECDREYLYRDEGYRKIGKTKVALNHLYDVFRQNTNLDRSVFDVIDALESCGFRAIIVDDDKSSMGIFCSRSNFGADFYLSVPKDKGLPRKEMAAFMRKQILDFAADSEHGRLHDEEFKEEHGMSISEGFMAAARMLA